MKTETSFKEYAIVSCGTLVPELTWLRKSGFLDARKILFTRPGLHEVPRELETRLREQVTKAREYSDKIIVVYGGRYCYIDSDDAYKTIDTILEDLGPGISRVRASHCIDMLASKEEREAIGNGEKVWWLTPGWVLYRHYVFQDWDKGKAIENFPKHTGGAILLDGIGFFDRYSEDRAEDILVYSDWMEIPIQPYEISLDRLKSLLAEQIRH
jgi:hypothetical protein